VSLSNDVLLPCVGSLKRCFAGLQQLTVVEVWSTFNSQLQHLTEGDIRQCSSYTFIDVLL